MTTEIFRNILRFILLLLLQVLIVQNINLGPYIIMLPYVLIILMLPFETQRVALMVISFFVGISLDIFHDSSGLHASACTLMGFSRHYVLKFISPRDGYDIGVKPTVDDMGLAWYLRYAGTLILIHHFAFFYLEIFRFNEFFGTFLRVILSSIGTFLLVYLLQFLFYTGKKR
ncbi:MAG TPA: rod shape-determining protein MreD [Bacteroidia bacterium]|nr:rod shape-determining protein MreD [Bacteroidia bacterium]